MARKSRQTSGSKSQAVTVADNELVSKYFDYPIEQLIIKRLELFTLRFDQKPDVDMQEGVNHIINFELKRGSKIRKHHIGFADVTVGKFHNNEAGASFYASYLFTVESLIDEGSLSDASLQSIGKYIIWPQYMMLFKGIIVNSDIKFPQIPHEPPSMNVTNLSTRTVRS